MQQKWCKNKVNHKSAQQHPTDHLQKMALFEVHFRNVFVYLNFD